MLLLFFSMAIGQLITQSRTINGKVTDENGTSIAGASVTIKGNKKGTPPTQTAALH